MKIKIEKMQRHELIDELRNYAHPGWYQLVLNYTTPMLRALVAYYRPKLKGV